jgi:hypothetical protein
MDEADQRVYLLNFHDDISRILNFRNWSIFNYHLPRSFEYHCFHAVALSIPVYVIMRFEKECGDFQDIRGKVTCRIRNYLQPSGAYRLRAGPAP